MSTTLQANFKQYVQNFENLQPGATNPAQLSWRTEEDVWVYAISGYLSVEGEDITLQMFYRNEQPIHVLPMLWYAAIGSGQYPMYFKFPILMRKHQTITATVTNYSQQENVYGSVSLLCVPTRLVKGPKRVPWQVRTQIYAVNVENLAAGDVFQASLNFDREGYVWTNQGYITPTRAPEALQVSYGWHNGETLVSELGYWGAIVGSGQRPLWFQQAVPVVANQSISINFDNLGATELDKITLGFQFTPTGREPRQID